MTDRSIVVRLRAEVEQFKRGMAEAAQAIERGPSAAAPKAETALGRMVQSAQRDRAAWETTGKTFLAVGGAITGIGAAALKTGISYNTLRQTSTVALTTMLGSASAAADQMDRLDEFASNSPFARQVFIEAQRQLIGFGMSAERVVPTLDAIQNAVAATGGSNQDIAELAEIVARVGATGKLTARDLEMFGRRGVDAASLIGSQMGKTGAQIREEITAGTLDADAAILALTTGMSERFEGAAAGVKETFDGAMDRVKAAWRDLSSELAEPLVGAEGGGFLIDLLNGIADAARGFQALPEPIKATTVAIAAATGGVTLLTAAFLLGFPRYIAFREELRKVSAANASLTSNLGRATRAVGMATAAFVAMQAAAALVEKSVGDVALGTNELRSALAGVEQDGAGVERLFTGMSTWLDPQWLAASGTEVESLRQNLQMLADPGFFQRAQTDLTRFMGLFDSTELGRYAARLSQVGDELAGMAASDLPAATEAFTALYEAAGGTDEAGLRLLSTMPSLRDALVGLATDAGLATDDATLLRIATGDLVPVVKEVADVTQEATAAQEAAAEALQDWRETVAASSSSFIDLMAGYQGVIDQNRAMAEATAEATDDAADSWEDYYDGFSVASSDWIASLEQQVSAQREWAENITALSERVNDTLTGGMRRTANEMIDELLALGPQGAAAVATMREMSDEELTQMVEVYRQKGAASAAAVTREIESHRAPRMKDVILQADTSLALGQINQFVRQQSNRVITMDVQGRTIAVNTGSGNQRGVAMGGVVGYAGGGKVPGIPPANPWADNVAASTQHGTPYAIRSGEWIINEPQSRRNDKWLRWINDGGNVDDVVHRVTGGPVADRHLYAPPRPVATGGAPVSSSTEVVGAVYSGTVYVVDPDAHARRNAARTRDALVANGVTM